MESQLRVQRGGRGDPQLLLLHGLGATGDVWNGWRSWLDRRGRVAGWRPTCLAMADRRRCRRTPAMFASRDEAATRYLRVSGLTGLLAVDDAAVDAGLIEQEGRWRLAMDPAAFGVGAPDMRALLAGTEAAVLLARGEHDPMNTDELLTGLGRPTATLAGLCHNAHVENPGVTITLLDRYR